MFKKIIGREREIVWEFKEKVSGKLDETTVGYWKVKEIEASWEISSEWIKKAIIGHW